MTTARERDLQPVPLAQPDIGPDEIALVNAVLAGRRFGIACSSGTAGLHMAVVALGIGEGDEVVTTPFSFVASANCVLYERARPVFVDVEEDTLGLDPNLVSTAS